MLIGIPTRGTVLARRLATAIGEFAGTAPAVGSVDPTLYRDDLRRRPARALEDTAVPEGGVDDKLVVLVDDVLMSGRTIRAALDALGDHGRPSAVQLAVLVDRGTGSCRSALTTSGRTSRPRAASRSSSCCARSTAATASSWAGGARQ